MYIYIYTGIEIRDIFRLSEQIIGEKIFGCPASFMYIFAEIILIKINFDLMLLF